MQLPFIRSLLADHGARRQSPLPQGAANFFENLLRVGILSPEEGASFLDERSDRLREYTTPQRLGHALVQSVLLTEYQLGRLLAGNTHGLVLGNYRVLEELGKGGMGVVYLAEHRLMKRRVAIKVLPVDEDCPAAIRERFFGEMRVLSELSHPNVVMAIDAGEMVDANAAPLLYLVTELVAGGDLEKHVIKNGLCGVSEACGYIAQAAAGLQAAHDRNLVHRDLKPSNLLLAAHGQIKLVDFGLARQFSSRLTDPRALLGSVEFMPPEQSHDPSSVGKEADVYGLGATLFWLLTGEGPHPFVPHVGQALRILQKEEPRRLRSLRSDAPEALDALVEQMLDRQPGRRPASPLAVRNALGPFLYSEPVMLLPGKPMSLSRGAANLDLFPRVLLVDSDLQARMLHRRLLEQIGCDCTEVRDLRGALEAINRGSFDLVLVDLQLPDGDGLEVCRQLRARKANGTSLSPLAPCRSREPSGTPSPADDVLHRQQRCSAAPTGRGDGGDPQSLSPQGRGEQEKNDHVKVIVLTNSAEDNSLAGALLQGADDCVVKPINQRQLLARVRRALEVKAAQDRSAHRVQQLEQVNQQLEASLRARGDDLRDAHNALLFTVARIAESRDGETADHLKRMQEYTKVLALEAAKAAPWQGLVDERFLEQLQRCVPLHDIGKIGLPDDILLKPASLSQAERELVQTHSLFGDRLLEALGKEHGSALDFLGMARVVVRSHHERWDGKGYPDKLVGEAIHPAARLVAVADVYDALRRRRLYKPAMTHVAAIRTMLERSAGQFDPTLLQALSRCHPEFERIYREIEE